MGDTGLSVIEASLASLRRRIRRIQLGRGIASVALVLFVVLSVMMSCDWLLGSLTATWRWALWGLGLCFILWTFWQRLGRPFMESLSLLQVARWLETRHPKLQEGVSTALQFSENAQGVSPELVKELCATASIQIQDFRPRQEVSSRSLKKVLIPAVSLFVFFCLFLIIWPGQISRLLLRSAAPFVTVGNAGAVYFEIDPGDLELLEGEGFLLELSFQGDLTEGLTLKTDSGAEQLSPASSDGDRHHFQYRFSELTKSFSYRAIVGSHESDQYQVKVAPRPRFQQVEVLVKAPAYSGIPEKQFQLGTGFKALAGSEIHFKGSLNTPALRASLNQGEKAQPIEVFGIEANWESRVGLAESPSVELILTPKLGEPFSALKYLVEVFEDHAPVITIKSPRESKLRMKRDDLLELDYEVIEYFGLSETGIEFSLNDEIVHVQHCPLPVKTEGNQEGLWSGAINLDLSSLDEPLQQVSQLKMRLVVSDNRPAEYQGPGRAYSDWIELIFDDHAPSLARQKLKSEQADFQKTLEQAQRDLREARQQMDRIRPHLRRPILIKEALEALNLGRQKMVSAEKRLETLLKQLPDTVQAHRSDEIRAASQKMMQSRLSLQDTPLQDTPESRHSELDAAYREADLAHQLLQKIRDAAHQDRHKINQLARVEELAQRQASLAQKNPHEHEGWQQKQTSVRNEIRKLLQQSPAAMAKALHAQSEQAELLAETSENISQQQGELARELDAESLKKQLEHKQERLSQRVSERLREARENQLEEANQLADAEAKVKSAERDFNHETTQRSFESLAKIESQKVLADRQEILAQGISELERGELKKAIQTLQEIQAQDASQLAAAIAQTPHPDHGLDGLRHAKNQSQSGQRNAQDAAQQELAGKRSRAADRNRKASQLFQDSAQSLRNLSRQAQQKAQQLSSQQESDQQLSLPAEPMANAFQEGSQALSASDLESSQQHASRAAQALKQAAQKARQALAEGRSANQSPRSEEGGSSQPGDALAGEGASENTNSPQQAQPDQGVPPQLSHLGISADDWERMKEQLKSGVGMAGEGSIPADYRVLTQQYFQELSKDR